MKFKIKNSIQDFIFDTAIDRVLIKDWAVNLIRELKESLKEYNTFAKNNNCDDFSNITAFTRAGKSENPDIPSITDRLDKLSSANILENIDFHTICELNYISIIASSHLSQCNMSMVGAHKDSADWKSNFTKNYYQLLIKLRLSNMDVFFQ